MQQMFSIANQSFTANIRKEGNNYVAICKEIGTSDFGNTKQKAVQNLKETTQEHLKAFPTDNPMYNVLDIKRYQKHISLVRC